MSTTELIHGDCREIMRTLPTASAACVVTDGPYEYELMGQSWDRDSAVFEPDTWREVRRVVSPGGYVAAFGGPRTWHHLTLAIEQGGLRIVTTLAWIYSDGNCTNRDTQLKTGFEPIVLAQVPAAGSLKRAVAEHGTGHLQIDDCRLPYVDDEDLRLTLQKNPGKTDTFTSGVYGVDRPQQRVNPAGRHPANVVIDERVAEALGRDARFFLCPKASPKERNAGLSIAAGIPKNSHTCVKPVALLDWVTRLICPVGGLVLDPFAGSASGGCGAVLAGRRYLGIEQDDLFVRTGRLRLAYWAAEAERRFAACAF